MSYSTIFLNQEKKDAVEAAVAVAAAKKKKKERRIATMESYKQWVHRNREFVHSLESLANGVTWLLPERFSNSEIGAEAVYSFLGVVSAVNQHIIDTAPSPSRPRGFGDQSKFPWSLCISTLKDLETLVEVAAQHFLGDDGKWDLIAAAEATKVLVRLALFRDSGYKMLLQGGEIVNGDNGKDFSQGSNGGIGSNGNVGEYSNGHLERRAIAALNRFGENVKIASDPEWWQRLRQRYEHPAEVVERPRFSSIWYEKGMFGRLFLTGEVLYIVRPLVYVLLVRRYGIRSWFPWILSLTVDLTGISLVSFAKSSDQKGREAFCQLSTSEKDEIKRRKLVLALYIMRDPFFSKHTRHRLEKTDKYLSRVPLIGFLTGKLVELIIGAQTRYTYTSAS